MEPLDLHYSRFKLVRLALLALATAAVAWWVATGGVSASAASRGPGARIARLLGPEGLQILGWTVAAAAVVFALLYLRRAFADPVAARADGAGVTIATLLGSRCYAARDIGRIELRHPAGQPILQLVPAAGRGRMRGLAVNGLAEDEAEVEAWIGAVHAAHAAAAGDGSTVASD